MFELKGRGSWPPIDGVDVVRYTEPPRQGHVQAARDDRRMRRHPTEIGQERRKVVVLELDDVGRREIVRDEDCAVLAFLDTRRAEAQRHEAEFAMTSE